MSGGFFRGTSTDQDTRFSNKKAKLLKSKKFASELETLVDMTKVKMDVMRPWIAKRVTELIGFEDEVLINFIYGLLEGKEVNGKEVQISLTGFMERNTGKFMKELWLLLLSAQQNLSGIPQQFLDAKEEETKKNKADSDRIAYEILRRREKEKQELERETAKMDGDGDTLRDKPAGLELNSKPDSMVSSFQPADENKQSERKSMRGRSRDSKSPDLVYRSSSPRWSSRSVSRSPPRRSRSLSSERRYPTYPRQSPTPRNRHVVQPPPSPRRRSSYSKRRSISPPRRRSPSPNRYRALLPRRNRSRSPLSHRLRSPFDRRSRSPRRWSRTPIRTSTAHHRSPSPFRRRSPSPLRRRSPSPLRRSSPSPVRRKSPFPSRRRSPFPLKRRSSSPLSDKSPSHGHRRSPSSLHRRPRSPFHRKPPYVGRESRSPVRRRYQRSPSTPRQQSISPVRHMSSTIGRKRSLSPVPRRSPRESSSPSSIRHNSISPVRRESSKSMTSPQQSHGERVRILEKNYPAHFASPRERAELSAKDDHRGSKPVDVRPIISLRSPQRDILDQNELHGKEPALSFSKKKTPLVSDASRERAHYEEQRSSSPRDSLHQRRERVDRPESPSPMVKATGPKPHSDHYRASVEDKNNFSAREIREQKYGARGTNPLTSDHCKDLIDSTKVHVLDDVAKSTKSQLTNSEGIPDSMNHREHYEKPEPSEIRKTTTMSEKKSESYVDEGDRAGYVNSGLLGDDTKRGYRLQESAVLPKLSRKSELNDLNGSTDSPSKEFDEHKTKVKEKKKRSKSDRHDLESDDYFSDDSYEERKEVKRRRKEEKKLKRDERRRRRDVRHRRKEERRAEKLKLKSVDTGNPLSDLQGDYSEDDNDHRRVSQTRGHKDTKSKQKNLEIELREKALESLRAKKGMGNSKD